MSSNILPRDQKILWGRSGAKCAIGDCRKDLIVKKQNNDKESVIGEMAHIEGENSTAARYNKDLDKKKCNAYGNLILLCRDHHKIIDDQQNTYTVDVLLKIKEDHERWVDESLKNEVVNVTFVELEIVTKYLSNAQLSSEQTLTVIPPKDKINKNSLSSRTESLITMGMTQINQVREFISNFPDGGYGERLKEGFMEEYEKLKNQDNFSGDELFDALLEFSSGNKRGFREKAAGLTILVYFFESCDVFEK